MPLAGRAVRTADVSGRTATRAHRDLARLRLARALHCGRRMLKALILACFVTACATADGHHPDAAPPPIDPAGTYAARSALRLAMPLPGPASVLVDDFRVADNPSRYLVDKIIAALPDGEPKTVAQDLAPFIAAYLDSRIANIAPRFLPGMRAVSDQLAVLTQQLETIETFSIDARYSAVRTVTGMHVGTTDVMLSLGGISEPAVAMKIGFNRDELSFDEHRLSLPYGRMVRLALDRGIVPAVAPGANDLTTLLRALVDCPHLGQEVADAIGVGSAALYSEACVVGMTAAATEMYGHLDALEGTTIELVAKGSAHGLDLDRDGHMDGITSGIWTGTADKVSLAGSTFEGKRD